MENNPFFKDYYGQTVLHPLGLTAVIVLGCAMLFLPRRYAVVPMLVMACFIAPAQRIAVFTLNFDLLRVMVLFGTARVLMRTEWKGFRLGTLDVLQILWALVSLVSCILLFRSFEPLKTTLGSVYDAVGIYFLFRFLVRDWEDFNIAAKAMAAVAVPVAIAFLVEHATGRNVFSVLGGVPEITAVRDGRLRCQGAFAHPILAGCFWAVLMPIMATQWWNGQGGRRWAVVGLTCAVTIVVMCASSTPAMGVLFGILAAGFFPLRRHMRGVRWAIVLGVIPLQLLMNNPVWHLIARVDILSGSTGWHRYHLIDEAVNHANEWWLIGSNVGTAHWGFGLVDVTNEYIVQGLHGGILLLVLFVTMVGIGFRDVGRMVRAAKSDIRIERSAWALGIALFIHAMNFVGVSYFGQITMVWYMTLALIGSISIVRPQPEVRTGIEHLKNGRRSVIVFRKPKHSERDPTIVRPVGV